MSHRAFLCLTGTAFAAALLATAAFNVWVDPLQLYREPSQYPPRFYPALQRHQNPGLARHRDYDTVVMGSSLFENLADSALARTLGGQPINLCLSAMSSYDLSLLLRHVLAQGKATRVVIGIDLVAFSGPDKRTGFGGPPPLWAYNNFPLDDGPYVLSLATTFRSLEALTGLRYTRVNFARDRPWYWAEDGMFSARAAVTGLDPEHLNQRFQQPPMVLSDLLTNFDRHLLALLRGHPQVQFDLVFPPYSALVWADYRQRGALGPALRFKQTLIESAGALPQVTMHDFQTEPWVFELSRYKDIYHYDPATGEAMLAHLANGSRRVRPADAALAVTRLQTLAETVDAKSVIDAARQVP